MKMNCNFYALGVNPNLKNPRHGAWGIKLDECRELNEQGYDIYWTMNGFDFGKRTKQDLKYINSFYADLDDGTLSQMQRKIKLYPEPSAVIQSGGGFHCYWYLKNEIDCRDKPIEAADWFREFTKSRIIPALNSDTGAADACRLLRAPFYKYWKDGLGEKYVDIVFESDVFYSLQTLEKFFPVVEDKRIVAQEIKNDLPVNFDSDNFWVRANNYSVKFGLEKLSGTGYVSGETYKFKREANTWRIFIDGVRRNAWIDKNGKIGSMRGLGPGIANWIYYHNRDWKKVAEIIKEVFEIKET